MLARVSQVRGHRIVSAYMSASIEAAEHLDRSAGSGMLHSGLDAGTGAGAAEGITQYV